MNEQEFAALVRQLRERVSVLEDRIQPLLNRGREADGVLNAWLAVDETTVALCSHVSGWKLPPSNPEIFEQGDDGASLSS